MKKHIFVSVIVIDYKKNNPLLVECLNAINKQSYKNFEIILVCDYQAKLHYPKLRQKFYGHYVGPARKRDDGAKMAKGDILAFIDDDAFPSKNWLTEIVKHFKKDSIVAVGGPGVTPPGVTWQEEASGWASASPVGAGPYTYRFLASRAREVDDYPSMNLSVRKKDFLQVGGFDSHYWPGEDTKLCLDLTNILKKKIIYEPKALVYHHRRPLLTPHLKQNGSFGLHRGFFARVLPKTSFRLIYFGPSIMLLGLVYLAFLGWINHPIFNLLDTVCLLSFSFYLILLIINAFWILSRSKSILQSIISIPTIFITHLWYGANFLKGFLFTDKLKR